MMHNLDVVPKCCCEPSNCLIDLMTGRITSGEAHHSRRYYRDLAGIFAQSDIEMERSNPLCYEVYEVSPSTQSGDIMHGTSILYPGTVCDEYFMTKGHTHCNADCGEVYFCLAGLGALLLQSSEGCCREYAMQPGASVYAPGAWAHRTVNTGTTPFVCFYSYSPAAGHDYAIVERSGFRRRIFRRNGRPCSVEA